MTIAVALGLWVVAMPSLAPAGDDDDDSNPHAHPTGGTIPGVFEPPPDVEQPDPAQPAGSIAVDLHDADDRPMPHEVVPLGVMINSIAKGDSRKHFQGTTDEAGRTAFAGLDTASNVAY